MSPETKTPAAAPSPERRTRSLAELTAEQGLTGPQNLDALIGAGEGLWNSDADFGSFLANLREQTYLLKGQASGHSASLSLRLQPRGMLTAQRAQRRLATRKARTMVPDTFPPLQGAISQAESWTRYLNARQPDDSAAALESIVWAGALSGELLPFTWRLTFDYLFRPGAAAWTTVREFEAVRQEVRRLFFTAREALDRTRQVAEALQVSTGRKPAGMDRLLMAIENACLLEEAVFRDWPSFTEPLPAVNPAASLPVDAALAEALDISVEEARRRMDARRSELNAERG